MSRRSQRKLKLAVLSAILFVTVLATGITAFSLIGKPVADEKGCYEGIPQRKHFILADVSTPRFSVEQARSLRSWFDQSFVHLDFNELFAVYTTEQKEMSSILHKPSFHVCGPAKRSVEIEAIGGDEVSTGYLRKQAHRLYEKQLAPELDALLDTDPPEDRQQKHQSPVMEMVGDFSRMPGLGSAVKLTLISDLIQNSSGVHFCRDKGALPSFKSFAKRGVYERLRPESLDGVDVEILMLERPGYGTGSMKYCTENELRHFWREFFKANGAASVKIVRIRAGTEG